MLEQRIDLAVRALELHKFDAIAFTGMSGALIAPPVSLKLGKPFIMVRKPYVSGHSEWAVEGDYGAKSYIILDDFMATGETVKRIRKQIAAVMPSAKYGGMLSVIGLTEARVEQYKKKKQPFPLNHLN